MASTPIKNTDCSAVNLYESLKRCKGETSLPGLRPRCYCIQKDQIVGWPKLPAPYDENATMESIATYEGDFKLAADSHWLAVDLLDTASNIKSAPQGEKPSKTFQNSSTIKVPGNKPSDTGFARMAISDDLVFVTQQRDGRYRVIGNEMFETDVNPNQESGQSVTDASGTTFEIGVTDVCPAPFYVGKLVLEDGVLDCSTGEITAKV